MSVATYRGAATRFRHHLAVLGPYVGPSRLDGHPDSRHEVADGIAMRVAAGEDAARVWRDYRDGNGQVYALELTVAALAADPRLHGLTRGRAAGIDREVWADLTASLNQT